MHGSAQAGVRGPQGSPAGGPLCPPSEWRAVEPGPAPPAAAAAAAANPDFTELLRGRAPLREAAVRAPRPSPR